MIKLDIVRMIIWILYGVLHDTYMGGRKEKKRKSSSMGGEGAVIMTTLYIHDKIWGTAELIKFPTFCPHTWLLVFVLDVTCPGSVGNSILVRHIANEIFLYHE